jgi:hypothetical protein
VRLDPAPTIDGDLSDACWGETPWTSEFSGLSDGVAPWLLTRAKLGWDEKNLYLAAELEEPHLRATATERDTLAFPDDDLRLYLDPDGDGHTYLELGINARGAVWDVLHVRPPADGGPSLLAWNVPGLRSAVAIQGTLDSPGDLDRGFTVELAIPFSALAGWAGTSAPPEVGDVWRMNLLRVRRPTDVAGESYTPLLDPETGAEAPPERWVWAPQGGVDMHAPGKWGFLHLVAADGAVPPPDAGARAGWALRLLYYRERAHFAREGRYTTDLRRLGLTEPPVAGVPWPPAISVTPHGFEAWLAAGGAIRRIDEEGRLRP